MKKTYNTKFYSSTDYNYTKVYLQVGKNEKKLQTVVLGPWTCKTDVGTRDTIGAGEPITEAPAKITTVPRVPYKLLHNESDRRQISVLPLACCPWLPH